MVEHEVVRPDGNDGIYGVVHFKNQAVGVLPIDEDGNIFLVGQHRYALDSYSWEIPEGGCPEGEDTLAAAKRELLEETGLTARNWQKLGVSHLSNSVCDELAHMYVATGLTEGKPCPEGTEVIARKQVPFEQALNMVLSGEITDAISIMTILLYSQSRSGATTEHAVRRSAEFQPADEPVCQADKFNRESYRTSESKQ